MMSGVHRPQEKEGKGRGLWADNACSLPKPSLSRTTNRLVSAAVAITYSHQGLAGASVIQGSVRGNFLELLDRMAEASPHAYLDRSVVL